MAIIELTSGVTCPVCNGNRVTLPDPSTDDSHATCANCEAELGPWRDVRDATGPLLSRRATQDVQQILKATVLDGQPK